MTRGVIGATIARCAAHTTAGKACKNAPIKGGAVCHKHGGSAPQVRRRANERIAFAADPAAAYLVSVMYDGAQPTKERMKAAAFLIDRSGAGAAAHGEPEAPWVAVLDKIVAADGDPDVLDAELVPDDDTPFTAAETRERPRRALPAAKVHDPTRPRQPLTPPRRMRKGVVTVEVDAKEFDSTPPAYDREGRKLAAQGRERERWGR